LIGQIIVVPKAAVCPFLRSSAGQSRIEAETSSMRCMFENESRSRMSRDNSPHTQLLELLMIENDSSE